MAQKYRYWLLAKCKTKTKIVDSNVEKVLNYIFVQPSQGTPSLATNFNSYTMIQRFKKNEKKWRKTRIYEHNWVIIEYWAQKSIPISGTASEVVGIDSATKLRNTVNDNKMVTSEMVENIKWRSKMLERITLFTNMVE